MTHDRLRPIVEAICMANDYEGYDIQIKTDQIMSLLHPINPTMNHINAELSIYAILQIVLDITKELEEWNNANTVKESLNQNQDLNDICPLVQREKEKNQ